MSKIVCFGEVMLRMASHGFLRFTQALPGDLTATFGGAEANVASSLATLGEQSQFVSAVPDSAIGTACLAYLRGLNVDVGAVARKPDSRLGIYFLETGANQRASTVIYDRENTAFSRQKPESWDWSHILNEADWFHTTGITPAVSKEAAQSTVAAVREARARGITVSFDLNFRKKLWNWGDGPKGRELARATVAEILPYVDVLIGNESDAEDMLGIAAEGSDVEAGTLDVKRYETVASRIIATYPQLKYVAITLRESVSATHNRWGAMIYDAHAQQSYFAPTDNGEYVPYDITAIVDRVGAGDSFGAAVIAAFHDQTRASDPQKIVDFAVAASALAHSIPGDVNYVSRSEVEALAAGAKSGRVQR
jgi:2-dehydro-3-deoxygluconokinase